MYRVIIVDDEEPVLNSFSHVVTNYNSDFEMAGTFRTGEEAIAAMPLIHADLVFMDVQMPGMDGIEAISFLKEQYPDTIFVLATAYERFDIAKKVIPLSVFSYLVKPITKPKLLSELDKVKTHLENRSQKRGAVSSADRPKELNPQKRLELIILSFISSKPDADQWLELCQLGKISGDQVALAIIAQKDTDGLGASSQWQLAIQQKLNYKVNCFSLNLAGKLLVVIANTGDSRDQDLTKRIKKVVGDDFKIVVGDFIHFSDFGREYLRCHDQLIQILGEHPSNETFAMRNTVESLLKVEKAERSNMYHQFWTKIFSQYSFELAKGKMIAFYTLFLHVSGLAKVNLPGIELAPGEEISQIQSLEDWDNWSGKIFPVLNTVLSERSMGEMPKVLDFALSYIHDHYNNPLQLHEVAEVCKISSSHLSRLFSKYLRMGFVDYVNRYKIGKAEKLIKEQNMNIKEIAYRVGYQDPNYFSRIFKRYKGRVPSDLG